MKAVFFVVLFVSVSLTLLADPAPATLEITDVLLLGMALVTAVLSLFAARRYPIGQTERQIISAVIFYISYLLFSALMGFLQGVPVMGVFRSVGPYLGFVPLIAVGFLPEKTLNPRMIAIIFIMVGLMQVCYLSELYFSHGGHGTTLSVLRNRITFKDQRTTLPLMLSVAILPLMFVSGRQLSGIKQTLMAAGVMALLMVGLFAGVITLTRAIFLSIVAGWLAFFAASLWQRSCDRRFKASVFFNRLFSAFAFAALVLMLVSFIPRIQLLESGLFARFFNHAGLGHVDYTNGRLYDEWIPALTTWINSGPLGWVLGVGAGNAFTVLSGEERTYIHNLSIYSLVFGGLYGFFATLFLYYILFKSLLVRAVQTQNSVYTGMFALLFSLYFYGQLFAVHKGLAFNEMLFLITGLTLIRPVSNHRH